MDIPVNVEIPSYREYKRAIWALRSAMKLNMMDSVKEALRAYERPAEPLPVVEISIAGGALPENSYVSPVVLVLRKGGYLRDDGAVVLRPMQGESGIVISL